MKLLQDVAVADPMQSSVYFSRGADDPRWAETLVGEDSPIGRPVIYINDAKFAEAGAENYRDKMVNAEALHLLKYRAPGMYEKLREAALSDDEYMEWARQSYDHVTRNENETRSFDRWHDISRLDQVIGGYLFGGDESIPTMREWDREKLPFGTTFRRALEDFESRFNE